MNRKSAGGYSKGDRISEKGSESKLRVDSLWMLDVRRVSEAGQDASGLLDNVLCEPKRVTLI